MSQNIKSLQIPIPVGRNLEFFEEVSHKVANVMCEILTFASRNQQHYFTVRYYVVRMLDAMEYVGLIDVHSLGRPVQCVDKGCPKNVCVSRWCLVKVWYYGRTEWWVILLVL